MRTHLLIPAVLGAALLVAIGAAPALAAPAGVAPAIEWQKLLGGSSNEVGYAIDPTADGGYILAGSSSSSATGDVAVANHGGLDLWAVKLNAAGAVQWQRLLGGNREEIGYSVDQTADGGYVLAGSSSSSASGDVTGTNHVGGYTDLWVVRLNAAGAVQWQKLLGGVAFEHGRSVQQTADGGYILLADSTSSASGDVAATNHGDSDLWVVRLNATGAVRWQRLLGGSSDEYGSAVRQTADGGYVLFGRSGSSASGGGTVTGTNHGGFDFWVVKLDGAGTILWQQLLGGSGDDSGRSVQQTADGGYVLLGESTSSAGGSVTGTNHGGTDCWVVKLNSAGAVQWQQLLGGSGNENGKAVRQTADGGYLLLGDSVSSASGDVAGTNHGQADLWAVRLDGTGAVRWQRLLGGSGAEFGFALAPGADGGYVLFGQSGSSASGDVTGTNHGGSDLWTVKLGAEPPSVYPISGGAGVPTDTNGDGTCDDVNGNGRRDFADVVLYFNRMSWIAANEPVAAFDFNANGRIDFADVVWLFNHL